MLEYPHDGVGQRAECAIQIPAAEPKAKPPPSALDLSLVALALGIALIGLVLCCRWPRAFDVWLDGRPGQRRL
jgi:hypothetical protein